MPKVKNNNKFYTTSDLGAALHDARRGIPLGVCCKKYGVPKTTLHSRLKKNMPLDVKKGPKTHLTKEEEDQIVKWIFYLSDRGFPVTKNQLLDSVKDIVTGLDRKVEFKDNRPGRHWYEAFPKRHPDISRRVVQNLTSVRASVTEKCLRSWFDEVQSYLVTKKLINITPNRIYNGDESAFQLCPKAEPVFTRKGTKAVHKVVNTNDKENITTLFMVNAVGDMIPPMIIYPYQRIPYSICKDVPKSWFVSGSQKGWMTAENFYEYVANCFHPWLVKNKIEFPVILYVDGDSSHLTLPPVNFCRDKQIELVALYPNSTHILQPLDVAVFHPVKIAWKKTVDDHRIESNGKSLKKDNFAPLLNKALQSMKNLTETIKHGFEAYGLYPFNPDAVNYNIFNKNKKKENDDSAESQNQEPKPDATEYQKNLDFLENYLKIDILKSFKDSERDGFYIGDEKDKGLFKYWVYLKQNCGKQVILEVIDNVCESVDENLENGGVEENITISALEGIETSLENQPLPIIFDDIYISGEIDISQDHIPTSIITTTEATITTTATTPSMLTTTEATISPTATVPNILTTAEATILSTAVTTSTPSTTEPTIPPIAATSIPSPLIPQAIPTTSSRVSIATPTTTDNILKDTSNSPKSQVPSGISELFKKKLFWPNPPTHSKKRKPKVKLPTILTQDEWVEFHEKNEEEKNRNKLAVTEKKLKRLEIKEQKRLEQEQKKQARELKKLIKQEKYENKIPKKKFGKKKVEKEKVVEKEIKKKTLKEEKS